MVLIPGVLIETFTHDENFRLIPWRVALVIGVVVGLFLIRWYLPFAIAGAIGLVGMFIELISTSW
jgi:xanthosine utilization system XapX-like protein